MMRRAVLLAAPLLAAGAILALARGGGAADDAGPLTATASLRDLEVSVHTIGRLEAVRATVVSSAVRGEKGKIIWIVADGVRVRQGDVLVRLDPTPFEEEVRRLEAKESEQTGLVEANEQIYEWEKSQAERGEEKALFDIRVANLDLKRVEKGDGPVELARLEGLAGQSQEVAQRRSAYLADLEALQARGYANPVEIADARRQAEEAAKAAATARRQLENYRDYALPSLIEKEQARAAQSVIDLEQTRKGDGFKIGKALAAVRQATRELQSTRVQLGTARRELGQTVIRAPLPGMVVLSEEAIGGQKGRPRVGDQVWQNQPLMYLPDLSRMQVRALVREIDLHKVVRGNKAGVRVDAYPDLQLEGAVESIGIMAESRSDSRSGEKYFQVVILIAGEEPRLRPGMTARAEINFARVRGTLAVPVQAVFREGAGEVCYVRRKALFERRPVTIGLRGDDWAQVTAGIAAGEEVALNPPPGASVLPPASGR